MLHLRLAQDSLCSNFLPPSGNHCNQRINLKVTVCCSALMVAGAKLVVACCSKLLFVIKMTATMSASGTQF